MYLRIICGNRRKKIVPGSLLKALVRPGGGDSSPVDGDQVIIIWLCFACRETDTKSAQI